MKVNLLHIDHYLSARKLEAEAVRMILNIYKGDSKTCGIHTTGGTESIFLCMLAYKNKYHTDNNFMGGIPEILMSKTTHPAFNRAADYFNLRIVYVDLRVSS